MESPSRKVADLTAAVTYLSTMDDRVGSLGICAGAAFAAAHAAADPRVRSLAMVAPGLQDAELARLALGGEEAFAARAAVGHEALAHYEKTGEVRYVTAVSDTDPDAAMYGPFAYYLDPARGGVPEYGNRFALMAWDEWLRFTPVEAGDGIGVPVLLVHSESAAIPEGARRFAARLKGESEFVWLEGRSQFDFYDDEATVGESVEAVAGFFKGM